MFKYVKDFFKTLSMEIGGVKPQSADITVDTTTKSLEIGVKSPDVLSVDERPRVFGENFSGSAEVRSGSFRGSDLNIKSGSFSHESAFVENPLSGFKPRVFSKSFYSDLVLRPVDVHLRKPKERSADVRLKARVKDGKGIPSIWNISYRRSQFVEKEKILDALSRLLRRYGGRPEKMEFLGYFRDIPIGMAEAVMVEKGKLILKISRRKKKKSVVVDLVAIRTPRGVMLEVVR